MPHSADNKVDGIVLVTEDAQEFLNPKQEITYREHLHFHVHDHSIPYIGAGLPIMFEAATDHPDLEPTDQERTYIHCGQTVTYGDA